MKNLVITTIGKDNQSLSWLGGEFDVVLIGYVFKQVFKYPGIYREIISRGLWNYDYYWMPDEDIYLTGDNITKMFAAMSDHDIHLAQPSIEQSQDSFPSWSRFIHCDGDEIRTTDFVEVMCPIFSKVALEKCIDTFPKSLSGWGLDLVWSKIMSEAGLSMAIINSVVAKHTRRIGTGGLYEAVKREGIRPSQERKRLMKEYGITKHSILNYDNRTDCQPT